MLTDHHLVSSGSLEKRWNVAVWGVVVVYFCLVLTISLSYHWGYLSTLTDVGTFDQAVWATLHGFPFLNTNAFSSPVNYFGIHFRPILGIFLPFYALLPRIEWMITAQSLAIAFSAWPVYLLGRRVLGTGAGAFCLLLAYLVNPFVLSVPPWVFRPETLALPFIALAILGVEKADFRFTLFSYAVILLCKEHFGIMVTGIGILWWLRNRDWGPALILAGVGLLYSFFVLTIFMPALSPAGKHVMLSTDMGQLSRYGWLGEGFGAIAQKLFFHLFEVVNTIVKMGGGTYLFLLLIFFLGTPLAGVEFLLPGLADLAANLLSANPMQRGVFYYHSVTLIPVIAVASIYGLKRISNWISRFSVKELAMFTVCASVCGGYLLAPLPLPAARNHWAPPKFINTPDPVLPLIRRLVGEDSAVSAQANIGAHFSQRQRIFQYPNKVGEVDAIILRLESPTLNIARFTNYPVEHQKYITGVLDAHLQINRHEYVESIESLLQAKEYNVLLWQDPWLVLSRNSVLDNSSLELIKKKLDELKVDWEIGTFFQNNHD